jgi:hypothetical protein
LSSYTYITEAKVLGFKGNHIHVYSNSWGPHDNGFTVGGPDTLAKNAIETGAAQVRNN